jgi:hypothetical protein
VNNRNVLYALLLVVAVLVVAASFYLLATSRTLHEGSAEAGFAREAQIGLMQGHLALRQYEEE